MRRRYRPSDAPEAKKMRNAHRFRKGRKPSEGAVMTHEAIAKELGITRQAVWAIERRAMRKLRAYQVLSEYL